MKGQKISAVIITLNEESRLTRCLDSINWMDEIIVIDSGSSDKTCELAGNYSKSIFYREFDDYASQKNYGASRALNNWIFSIDADEVMSNELRDEIKKTLSAGPDKDLYTVPRRNIYFGHDVTHVLGKDEPVRLYKKDTAGYYGIVHEKVKGGPAGRLTSFLIHHSCDSYGDWLSKKSKYTKLDAIRQFKSGRRFRLSRFLCSPGLAGLGIALGMAFYTFKLELELRRL